jgi:hypothetical protein
MPAGQDTSSSLGLLDAAVLELETRLIKKLSRLGLR